MCVGFGILSTFQMETRSVTRKNSSLPTYGGIISPVTFFLLIYIQYIFYLCILCCLRKFAEINPHSQCWENSASVLIRNQAMSCILSTDFSMDSMGKIKPSVPRPLHGWV